MKINKLLRFPETAPSQRHWASLGGLKQNGLRIVHVNKKTNTRRRNCDKYVGANIINVLLEIIKPRKGLDGMVNVFTPC